jgi:hypothetical protein
VQRVDTGSAAALAAVLTPDVHVRVQFLETCPIDRVQDDLPSTIICEDDQAASGLVNATVLVHSRTGLRANAECVACTEGMTLRRS